MKIKIAAFAIVVSLPVVSAQASVSFEELPLPGPETYYNGSDNAGGFSNGGLSFNNNFTDFGGGFSAWSGWSYSNVTDTTTPGYGNQYSAYPGGGSTAGGAVVPGATFGVAFSSFPNEAFINLPGSASIATLRITNTTYTALSMRDGDSFAKKFGGPTGNDPDFLKVTFTAYPGANALGSSGAAVDFYLADFRFSNNAQDYIVSDWRSLDLSSLAGAGSIGLSFTSTDNGMFGINTPTYAAIDQIVVVPEPTFAAFAAIGSLVTLRRRRTK